MKPKATKWVRIIQMEKFYKTDLRPVNLDELYRCKVCGVIAEKINGFIFDKGWHPNSMGCDCRGSSFEKVDRKD